MRADANIVQCSPAARRLRTTTATVLKTCERQARSTKALKDQRQLVKVHETINVESLDAVQGNIQ